MYTSTIVVDQRATQLQNVVSLAPPALAVRGSDGTLTAPQVFTTPSPTDGDLSQRTGHGVASYRRAREIRRDPTVRMVREMAMAPILMAEWEYEETESAPPGARELVKEVMDRLKMPLVKTSLCGMCDYGWQPYELVADQSPDGYTWPKLKALLQDITTILVDAADGSFFGLKQNAMYGQRNGFVYLLEGECIVISQDVEGTDWYGESTLKSLEKTCDADEQVSKNGRKYDQKIAGTHWVIYYPLGTSKMDGETLENAVVARRLLANAEAVGGMIVPRSVVQSLDTMSAQAANDEASQWKIELLSDQGKGQQPFTDRQKYLDVLKVRAFGFPERAVLEGQFGTKAEAEAHADMAVNNMEARHALLVSEHYNPKVVDWVLEKNYGPEYRGTVRVKPVRLADADKVMFRELYSLLLSDPTALQREVQEVDIHQVRDRLNIPEAAALPQQYVDPDYGLPPGFEQAAPEQGQLDYDQAPAFTPVDELGLAFDPSEPRDWRGRWTTDTGGGNGGGWASDALSTMLVGPETKNSRGDGERTVGLAGKTVAKIKSRSVGSKGGAGSKRVYDVHYDEASLREVAGPRVKVVGKYAQASDYKEGFTHLSSTSHDSNAAAVRQIKRDLAKLDLSLSLDWQTQPRVDAGSPDGGEWEAERNIKSRKGKGGKDKPSEGDAKTALFKKHSQLQDERARKRNAAYAKLPHNDAGKTPDGKAPAHKSDGRRLYGTPTEDALTKVGNFQLKGRLSVGSGPEGTAKEMATYEHPDWPGVSVNVNPDGSWNLYNSNTFSYTVGGTGPQDLAALLKRKPAEVLKMAWDDPAYDADVDPTDAQREAGNYRKGRLRVAGHDVAIETPKGERRKEEWPRLPAHYGYFNGTEGEDGDHLDCFVGKHRDADSAYVIYQEDGDGEFDEHKVMLGFRSRKKAVKAYSKAYGGREPGRVVEVPVAELGRWMEEEGVKLAFDPSEPRDERGRWTADTGGGSGGGFLDGSVESQAHSLSRRLNEGSYVDAATVKNYMYPDTKRKDFMVALESQLAERGLKLQDKMGTSIVQSARGGAKTSASKVKSWRVVKRS